MLLCKITAHTPAFLQTGLSTSSKNTIFQLLKTTKRATLDNSQNSQQLGPKCWMYLEKYQLPQFSTNNRAV